MGREKAGSGFEPWLWYRIACDKVRDEDEAMALTPVDREMWRERERESGGRYFLRERAEGKLFLASNAETLSVLYGWRRDRRFLSWINYTLFPTNLKLILYFAF